MINITELRITPDGKNLLLTASVKTDSYYNDVYIDKISIDTQDTYVSTGVSSTPIYTNTLTGSQKNVSLSLTSVDLSGIDLSSNLFVLYITTKGTPSADTPCGQDSVTTIGVVFNSYTLYEVSINYLKELNDCCNPSKNFIDSILKSKALDLAIKTGNTSQAVLFWNKYIKDSLNITTDTFNNCGCNG